MWQERTLWTWWHLSKHSLWPRISLGDHYRSDSSKGVIGSAFLLRSPNWQLLVFLIRGVLLTEQWIPLFGPCGTFALDFDLQHQAQTRSAKDDASQSSEAGWPEWKAVAFGYSHSLLFKAEVVICEKHRLVSENLHHEKKKITRS